MPPSSFDLALFHRQQALSLLDATHEAIRAILMDPKAPPAVRLKAALAIIDQAMAPLPDLPREPAPEKPAA